MEMGNMNGKEEKFRWVAPGGDCSAVGLGLKFRGEGRGCTGGRLRPTPGGPYVFVPLHISHTSLASQPSCACQPFRPSIAPAFCRNWGQVPPIRLKGWPYVSHLVSRHDANFFQWKIVGFRRAVDKLITKKMAKQTFWG
eukprot:jgi/Botrbrau1/22547/Bobra.114_2s0070.1